MKETKLYQYHEVVPKLIWMDPFDVTARKTFFGNHYQKAQELCQWNEELLSIPVCAYLVREVIKTRQDQNLRSRWDIYTRFVNSQLKKYLSDDDSARMLISALSRISYDAMAQPQPMWEIVPYSFWSKYWQSLPVPASIISFTGIAAFVARPPERDRASLLFSHRSFQEFLAAKWVSESDDKILQVIDEG